MPMKMCRAVLLLVGVMLVAVHPAGAQTLISDLPLDGNLLDRVSGTPAEFERSSTAHTAEGAAVPPNAPRFETFALASGFNDWVLPTYPADERGPFAVCNGWVFASDKDGRIWRGVTGDDYEWVGSLPPGEVVRAGAGFATPGGALLVGTGQGWADPPNGKLFRSADDGVTWTQVLAFRVGVAAHWNFTALGPTIFVSEYGQTSAEGDGNARQIFRSDDDGCTWQLVYDPPPHENMHCHQILADPWGGCVYQMWGDTNFQVIRTCNGGQSWEFVHDYYLATGGLARPEGLYWGHEGVGVPGIQRYDRVTGQWTHVFRPWFSANNNQNIYSLFEHAGVMYCPFAVDRQELWASPDGEHWTLLRHRFSLGGTYGLRRLVGHCGEWVHGYYLSGSSPHLSGDSVRFRPGQVEAVIGLRLEPPAENLLGSLQASSAEEGLAGWSSVGDASVSWEPGVAYDGSASLRVDWNFGLPSVICPAVPTPIAAGRPLKALVRLRGAEHVSAMYLGDDLHPGPAAFRRVCAFDAWTPGECAFQVAAEDNRVRLCVMALAEVSTPKTFWLDGYQVTAGQVGRTWVPGGSPRAGDFLKHTVAFGSEWTDVLCFNPDFDSVDGDVSRRVVQSWVENDQRYVKLEYDRAGHCWQLTEAYDGQVRTTCRLGQAEVQPGEVHRFAVRHGASGCELHLRVAADRASANIGLAWTVQPAAIWIGCSPAGTDHAPGVYARSRVWAGWLSDEQLQAQLGGGPVHPPRGDCNCDGLTDLGDINAFVLALTSAEAYAAAFPDCNRISADCNRDGIVSLADINSFVDALTP